MAVAILFAHTMIMGAHVPPALRAVMAQAGASAFAASICHSDPDVAAAYKLAAASHGDHGGDHGDGHGGEDGDGPADAGDHLKRCPVCLSLGGAKLLGPATAPDLPPPGRVARAEPYSESNLSVPARRASPFSARAPPATA